MTAANISAWLTSQIAGILSVPEDDIAPDATFDSFGLASRDAVSLSGDLEDYLNRRLSPTLLYQYPTIRKLADHLAGSEEPAQPARSAATSAPAPSTTPHETAEQLSEDEAEAALLKKLIELDE